MITKRLLRFALGPSFLDSDYKRENAPIPYKLRIEQLVKNQNQILKLSEAKGKFKSASHRTSSHNQAARSINVRQYPLLAEMRDQVHLPYSATILMFYNVTTRLKFRISYGLFNSKFYRIFISDTVSCIISVIHDSFEIMFESAIYRGLSFLPTTIPRVLASLGTDLLLQPIRELKILHSASMIPFTRFLPFFTYDKNTILLGFGFFLFKESKRMLSDTIYTHCVNVLQKTTAKLDNKDLLKYLDKEASDKAAHASRYIDQSRSVFKMMLLDNISSIALSPVQILLWGLTMWNFGNSPRSLSYFPSGIDVVLKPSYQMLLFSTTVEVVLFIALNAFFEIVAEDLLFVMQKKLMRGKYVFLKTICFNDSPISDETLSETEGNEEDEDNSSIESNDNYFEDELDFSGEEFDFSGYEFDFSGDEEFDDTGGDNFLSMEYEGFNRASEEDDWIDEDEIYYDGEGEYSENEYYDFS